VVAHAFSVEKWLAAFPTHLKTPARRDWETCHRTLTRLTLDLTKSPSGGAEYRPTKRSKRASGRTKTTFETVGRRTFMKATKATPKLRELFIEELAEVRGGDNPVKELLNELTGGGNSTMACCEEGDCCNDPISFTS
jgi:hypothetical protein